MLDHNFEPFASKPLRRLSLRGKDSPDPATGAKAEHFVEPWRLTDQEKSAISKALKAEGYEVAATYAGNDEKAAAFTAETGIKVNVAFMNKGMIERLQAEEAA